MGGTIGSASASVGGLVLTDAPPDLGCGEVIFKEALEKIRDMTGHARISRRWRDDRARRVSGG